jgi:hypothetical protein
MDSLMRVIFICGLVAVTISMVFVSDLNAQSSDKGFDKKDRIVIPREENTKPGDADDLNGNTHLDFGQEYYGEGDYTGPSKSSTYKVNRRIIIRNIIHLILYQYFSFKTPI